MRSKGGATRNKDCLGVYRMVDSLNERPVFKQDDGVNYLYYNEKKVTAEWPYTMKSIS